MRPWLREDHKVSSGLNVLTAIFAWDEATQKPYSACVMDLPDAAQDEYSVRKLLPVPASAPRYLQATTQRLTLAAPAPPAPGPERSRDQHPVDRCGQHLAIHLCPLRV